METRNANTITLVTVDTDGDIVGNVALSVTWGEDGSVSVSTRSNGRALVDVPAGSEITIEVVDSEYARAGPPSEYTHVVTEDDRIRVEVTERTATATPTPTPTPTSTPTPTVTPTPTPTVTPTPTPTATPTPTPAATPTPTSMSGNPRSPAGTETGGAGGAGGGLGMVPVVLGVLGLGGAGAWLMTRGSDESEDGGTPGEPATGAEGGPRSTASGPSDREPDTGSTGPGPDSAAAVGGAGGSSRPDSEPAHDSSSRSHGGRVPDEIPGAPTATVSVEYDALTDREPIGAGGNADVTRATLPTAVGEVTLAIKEPRLSGTLHTGQVERLLAEAETWDKLDDHDHIVGMVDYGSEPVPWIAMEYMDGGHLGERAGEMDVPQALWTAIAVTKGVRHAHRRGVAHLDLKPENVLFRAIDGAWDVPKVADWGLSKHLLNHSKSVEGFSPQYAAPEQFSDDHGTADDITDVYQLGAVFYELFTGRPPFQGDTAEAVYQVLDDEPTPPSEIADVPDALDEILLTALAKEKTDRYESVLLLRNALQEVFDAH